MKRQNLGHDYNKIASMIKKSGWHIGFCEFIKKDGTNRKMWFHGLLHKNHLSGGARAYDPVEKRIVWVRDIKLPKKKCIRSIKVDMIKKLSVNGQYYYGVKHES